MRKGSVIVAALALAGNVAGGAVRASAADRVWSAPGCGEEPAAPTPDISTVAHYKASVDQVGAYEKAARAYNACVTPQAVKDGTANHDAASESHLALPAKG